MNIPKVEMFVPGSLLRRLLPLMFLHSTIAVAAEIPGGIPFPVQAAIVQENGEPVAGAALCAFDADCGLLMKDAQGFGLTIKVPYGRRCSMKQLSLSCASGDCSFANGRAYTSFTEERELPFFEGSFGQELVYRQQTKLGSVLLILPDFVANCRMSSTSRRRS